MTTFESEIKKAECNQDEIYELISDLNNIERFKEMIPNDKIKDVTFDADSCQFSVDPVGQLGLRIVDREPSKTVKFAADQSPIDFNLWIQMKQVAENDTRIKVTVKADLNPMVKMMVEKPITMFVEKIAEGLTKIPFKDLKKNV
ncbi:MAG: SRPBCC family protein [Paludibacteraceae bacterium]|nr:SRPBCC family protein [Paludibacteraceae bacterium]